MIYGQLQYLKGNSVPNYEENIGLMVVSNLGIIILIHLMNILYNLFGSFVSTIRDYMHKISMKKIEKVNIHDR